MSAIAARLQAVAEYIPRRHQLLNPWVLLSGLAVFVLLLPTLLIGSRLLAGSGSAWTHALQNLLPRYALNTGLLMVGVACGTLVIGVGAAWLVVRYDFPGRGLLGWALILPMAMPAYIVGFTYYELLDDLNLRVVRAAVSAFGPAHRRLVGDLFNLASVTFILCFTLYPYVYLIARASFLRQSGSVLEVTRLMGRSGAWAFLRVIVPLARPAIVGGLLLVLMEVLNDYAVAQYYGIDTFTTGIFRAWSGMGELNTALSLAGCLTLIVFLLLAGERWQRRRLHQKTAGTAYRPLDALPLRGPWKAVALLGLVPVVVGFGYPVYRLLGWAWQSGADSFATGFVRLVGHSLLLAGSSTVTTIVLAILIVYSSRVHRHGVTQVLTRLAVLSYALPGAVIAVGIMLLLGEIDALSTRLTGHAFAIPLLLNGSLAAVVYGCTVRFLAVAVNPMEAGFERICGRVDEASRALGASPLRTLLRVDLPLLKGTIATAAIFTFVDTMKELPLTLILRPSNVETLSTRVFDLASDERVAQSAGAALAILLVGLLPITLMHKLLLRSAP